MDEDDVGGRFVNWRGWERVPLREREVAVPCVLDRRVWLIVESKDFSRREPVPQTRCGMGVYSGGTAERCMVRERWIGTKERKQPEAPRRAGRTLDFAYSCIATGRGALFTLCRQSSTPQRNRPDESKSELQDERERCLRSQLFSFLSFCQQPPPISSTASTPTLISTRASMSIAKLRSITPPFLLAFFSEIPMVITAPSIPTHIFRQKLGHRELTNYPSPLRADQNHLPLP